MMNSGWLYRKLLDSPGGSEGFGERGDTMVHADAIRRITGNEATALLTNHFQPIIVPRRPMLILRSLPRGLIELSRGWILSIEEVRPTAHPGGIHLSGFQHETQILAVR